MARRSSTGRQRGRRHIAENRRSFFDFRSRTHSVSAIRFDQSPQNLDLISVAHLVGTVRCWPDFCTCPPPARAHVAPCIPGVPSEETEMTHKLLGIGKMTLLALALCGYTSLSGCSTRSIGNPTSIESRDSSGTVSFALQVAPGVTVLSAGYMITGPNSFSKSGTIDLSSSSTLTATIGGLPAGTGYLITLSATATDGATNCGGSAHFDVTAGHTVMVVVPLTCHEPPRTGSVSVSGVLNICPAIDGITANPGEVIVGSSIALSVAAHDTDSGPSPLTYAWQTNLGTLSNPSSSTPTLNCTGPGKATVSVTVSDGDPAPSCAATLSADVTCTSIVTGVVASAALVPGSPTDPVVNGGHYQGAKVCADANDNGRCETGETATTTDANGQFTLAVASTAPIIADIGTGAVNTADGSTNPTR